VQNVKRLFGYAAAKMRQDLWTVGAVAMFSRTSCSYHYPSLIFISYPAQQEEHERRYKEKKKERGNEAAFNDSKIRR
jgi:hypothetical protein